MVRRATLSLTVLALLGVGQARATDYWQDQQNTNGMCVAAVASGNCAMMSQSDGTIACVPFPGVAGEVVTWNGTTIVWAAQTGDHKVAVDVSDTSPDYLAAKLSALAPIFLTTIGGGAVSPPATSLKEWHQGSTLTSGAISSWTDSSGNGNTATQASGGAQPTVNASSIGGNKGATFAGAQGLHSALTLAGAKTIAVVFQKTGTVGSGNFYSLADVGTGSLLTDIDLMNIGGYQPYSFAGDYTSTTLSGVANALDTSAHILILTYNGGSSSSTGSYTFTLDGSLQTVVASSAGARASTDLTALGARIDSTGTGLTLGFVGDIDEELIYSGVLSSPDMTTLQSYLTGKYVGGGGAKTVQVSEQGAIVSGSTSTTPQNLGLISTSMLACTTSGGVCTMDGVTVGGGLTFNTGTATETLANAGPCSALQAVEGSTTSGLTCDPISGVAANGNAYFNAIAQLDEDAANWGWNDSTHVANINGDFLVTAIAAPSTPAAGKAAVYVDSTSKNIAEKNDAGTVNHGIQSNAGTDHEWVSALADNGTVTLTQPAFSDVSGTESCAQSAGPFTGDVTKSAGSCATKDIALSDGSLVSWPTAGAWANGNMLFLSGGDIIAVPTKSVARSSTIFYSWNDFAIASTGINCWLTPGPTGAGTINPCQPDGFGVTAELAKGFAANFCRISVNVVVNSYGAAGATPLTFQVTRNGSNVTGCSTSGIAAGFTGVKTSGEIGVSSATVNDTWGVVGNGFYPAGGASTLYVDVEIYQ